MWAGALLAGIVGLGLGFLTLRLRGIFAAIMAWFFGIALMGLANNLTTLTRGSMGLHPDTLLSTSDNRPYFYIIMAMLVLIYIVLKQVTKSPYGLAFKAIGQNIDAARASGINPTKYRVYNFALSCACAGLLGGFYGGHAASISSARPTQAESGNPPVNALPRQITSGTVPECSQANHLPVRPKPV